MITQLYPYALDIGISIHDFWQYSIGEIRDLIDSRVRMNRQQKREQLSLCYHTSALIGLYIQIPYVKEGEIVIPHLWELAPDLFEEEREQYEKEHQAETAETARISRMEYARQYNRIRKQKGL